MRLVPTKDTKPELAVRGLLPEMGLRYRANRLDLPGKPDIVLATLRKVIFVHGCFWHRHRTCRRATTPARNAALWQRKFENTKSRDRRALVMLRRTGWDVLVVWECELNEEVRLRRPIKTFLSDGRS